MTNTKKIDMNKKGYTVFSLRIANGLCKRGFRCLGTAPQKEKPWLNVFFFPRTQEVLDAIEELKPNNSNKKNRQFSSTL